MSLIDQLGELKKSHPPLSEEKTEKNIYRLGLVATYYDKEAANPIMPRSKALMFRSFANTVYYAITVVRMHRALTRKINELYEEHKND